MIDNVFLRKSLSEEKENQTNVYLSDSLKIKNIFQVMQSVFIDFDLDICQTRKKNERIDRKWHMKTVDVTFLILCFFTLMHTKHFSNRKKNTSTSA